MMGGDTGVYCHYCKEILPTAGDTLCWKPICHAKATDDLARKDQLLRECAMTLKIIWPFLKDLIKRPRSSASAQRIGADAEDSYEAVKKILYYISIELAEGEGI